MPSNSEFIQASVTSAGGVPGGGDAPSWDAIDFAIHCPRCDYDLRMLQTPRCPECGLIFTWAEVISQHHRRRDFLFEHQIRRRPCRSWWATFRRSLRPFRFWRSVSIHDQIATWPLWLMLMTSLPVFKLTMATVFASASLAALGAAQASNATDVIWRWNTLSRSFWYHAVTIVQNQFELIVAAIPLAVTLVGVSSLRQTLGRRRVRLAQVLRVVAYSSAPFMFYQAFGCAFMNVALATIYKFRLIDMSGAPRYFDAYLYGGFGMILLLTYLVAGLRTYLQLPRAVTVSLAIVVVSALVAAIIPLARIIINLS